jgi:hypothetical protein
MLLPTAQEASCHALLPKALLPQEEEEDHPLLKNKNSSFIA